MMAVIQEHAPPVALNNNNNDLKGTKLPPGRRRKQRSLTKHLWNKTVGNSNKNNPSVSAQEESSRTLQCTPSSEFFSNNTTTTNTTSPPAELKSCLKRPSTTTTTTRSSTDNNNNNKKEVTFDTIVIHEHYVMLGDNPSVTSGPPLTIVWKSHATFTSTVDEYEQSRPYPPRSKNAMLVPHMVREEWLRNAGYARSQFAETERMIQKIKRERATSLNRTRFVQRFFWKANAN